MRPQNNQLDTEAERALEAAKQSIDNIEAIKDRMKSIITDDSAPSSYYHKPSITHYYEAEKAAGIIILILAVVAFSAALMVAHNADKRYLEAEEQIARLSNRIAVIEHSHAVPQVGEPIMRQPSHN